MGKFKALAKLLKMSPEALQDSNKVLEALNTEEKAMSTLSDPKARQEYLGALDEVYGDKTLRQKLTGHTTDAYHGSFSGDITDFTPNLTNKNSSFGKAIYTTDNPLDASQNYAEIGSPDSVQKVNNVANFFRKFDPKSLEDPYLRARRDVTKGLDSGLVYPLKINLKNNADLSKGTTPLNAEFKLKLKKSIDNLLKSDVGNKLVPADYSNRIYNNILHNINDDIVDNNVNLNSLLKEFKKNFFTSTKISEGTIDNVLDESSNLLKDLGYDSITVDAKAKFPELVDGPTKHHMLNREDQVRSTNAAFDPRFKNSSNILAGVAAIPMTTQINPINSLKVIGKDIANSYADLKDDAAAKLIDLTRLGPKNEEVENITKTVLSTAADPINLLSGGVGAAATGLQFMEDENRNDNSYQKLKSFLKSGK